MDDGFEFLYSEPLVNEDNLVMWPPRRISETTASKSSEEDNEEQQAHPTEVETGTPFTV
jgi:hypothetical protein